MPNHSKSSTKKFDTSRRLHSTIKAALLAAFIVRLFAVLVRLLTNSTYWLLGVRSVKLV